MGSWSRGGGRRLCRGEVNCRVELKNFLLSPFLAHQPSSRWNRSFRFNALPRLRNLTSWFISTASPVLSRFNSSFFLTIPALIIHHSIFSLQAQNLPFQQILPILTSLLYPFDCLHDHGTGPDLSCSSVYFLKFFLLHVLYRMYRNVSYAIKLVRWQHPAMGPGRRFSVPAW